jgi:hypothetical protein
MQNQVGERGGPSSELYLLEPVPLTQVFLLQHARLRQQCY